MIVLFKTLKSERGRAKPAKCASAQSAQQQSSRGIAIRLLMMMGGRGWGAPGGEVLSAQQEVIAEGQNNTLKDVNEAPAGGSGLHLSQTSRSGPQKMNTIPASRVPFGGNSGPALADLLPWGGGGPG